MSLGGNKQLAEIVISEYIDDASVDRLRAAYSVHVDETLWERRAELEERLAHASGFIVRHRTQVDAGLIARAPRLRVIGRLGTSLDNIDRAACKARGIVLCPALGANANAVAEYVMGTAIMLLRWTAFTGSPRLMRGEWPRQVMSKGGEISGRTVGIIGYGSIGQLVASKARAFNMQILAFDPFLVEGRSIFRDMARPDLRTVLSRSDIVTLHSPLTRETRGLIGPKEIAAIKPGALFINTACGGIVDEEALASALRSGHLGGAAIDVYDTEPIDARTAALYAGLPNVLLTPHVAGLTNESSERVNAVTVDNVMRVLKQAS